MVVIKEQLMAYGIRMTRIYRYCGLAGASKKEKQIGKLI
jgi:hypothetical protein